MRRSLVTLVALVVLPVGVARAAPRTDGSTPAPAQIARLVANVPVSTLNQVGAGDVDGLQSFGVFKLSGRPLTSRGKPELMTMNLAWCPHCAANSWAFENLGRKMIQRDLKPAFKVRLQQKDLRLVSEAAREICVPVGLSRAELEHIDHRLVASQRQVTRGETLFHAGDTFTSLFAVWTGFFKTVVTSKQGHEQVTGFQTAGELMGLSGIDSGQQEVHAIALEDSQVCVIPFAELESLQREVPGLQIQFNKMMSREIATGHQVMLQLGSMHAEERVAAFLLNLTHRLQARGFSASALLLRMSREEIGSFLGLQFETVSRTLSKFRADGMLAVRHRQIEIIDSAGLQRVLDASAAER